MSPREDDMPTLNISLGALAPDLSKQLKDFDIDPEEIEHLEKDRKALDRVRIRGLVPRSQVVKAEQKLVNNIVKLIESS